MKLNLKKIAFGTIAFLMASNIFAQGTPSAYTDADLVWKDDFDGKKLNKKNWNYEIHEPGWVNNELQSYGTSTKNTYVKDGCLVIQPIKKENPNGTVSYTSGRVNTMDKHTFTYGRVEARLKVPKGQGYLPAFWMMPNDESFYGQWPKCGEIDIMEVLGHDTPTVYGTLHFGEPHSSAQGSYTLESGNFADEFHVFAVEWEPGEMRFYCDDVNYKTINNWYTKRQGFGEVTFPAPFDQPFYIIFNVAVGGDWPGYPDETTTFGEEAQMVVDYVKVYQKKEYNEDVDKPVIEVSATAADSSGNLLKTTDKDWGFLNFNGGAANYSYKNEVLDIYPIKDASVLHAIQVVNGPIAMIKGSIYRLSFDAYADEARTMIACISAPNAGWVRYLQDTTCKLTTEKQKFVFDFKMLDNSDPTARLEFNCGNQGSLAPIHISNVRLEKTGEIDLSAAGLNLLPDGNMIYNGQFQEGKGRLDKWKIDNKIDAQIKVSNDNGRRELEVTTPEGIGISFGDVNLSQDGLTLPAGKQYVLRFDAYASRNCKMCVRIGNWKEFPALTTKPQHFEYIYSAPKTNEYILEFLLANSGATVYLDNVSFKENSCLLNGEFDSGMAAWELYSHQNADVSAEVVETESGKEAAITINKTGNMDWMIQLKQNNIVLEKGKKYHVSLKAKSDKARTIMWALQRDGSKDDNWIPYSDTIRFNVTPEFQTFEKTFTMENATDEHVIFTISMGAVSDKQIKETHTVVIDSVVVEEVKE